MTTVKNRYKKDAEGQWWYLFPDGRRVRCVERKCEVCDGQVVTYRDQRFCSTTCRGASKRKDPVEVKCVECGEKFQRIKPTQTYCSHGCAARAYHARQDVTTKLGVALKNADNKRFSRDERGQWWYTPDGYPRTRASIRQCAECKGHFLANIYSMKTQGCCSKPCAQAKFHRENPGQNAGPRSGRWKGGRKVDERGYVLVMAPSWHPLVKGRRKYIQEHRLVVEQREGRFLLPHETVHHINGVRDDNRPENLELWAKSHPPGQRIGEQKKHCPTCMCGVKP